MRHEAQRRSALAVSLFAVYKLASHPDAHNVWLPMERDAASHHVSIAATSGIKLTDKQSITVDAKDQTSGILFCLDGTSFDDLTEALTLLPGYLNPHPTST